jgi:uncharacterized protein YjdB
MSRIVFVSRAMRLVRFLPFIALAANTAHAQSISVGAGDSARVVVAPGGRLAVPVRVDLSAAAPLTLASLQADVRWNSARLTFDSVRVVASTGFSQTANTASAGTGLVTFNAFSTSALSESGALTMLYFTAGTTSGATRLSLTPTEGGAEDGTNVLARLIPRGLDVCVASQAKWGDVNDDGAVSIIDAQQIARFSVGLSVANVDAVRGRGDVNADANVSIIDAQQIARFSVALSSSARTNTAIAQVPPVQTLAIVTPGAVRVGQGTALSATALDSTGASVAGCAPVVWSSSNAAVATVSINGVLTAVSTGSVTITATSAGKSASVAIAVTAVPVASVVVSPSTRSILVGQVATLTATPVDSLGVSLSGRAVTWQTSNTAVATVSSIGVVTAVATGVATITATSEGKSGSAAVSVGAQPVASVTMSPASSTLFISKTLAFTTMLRDSAGVALNGRTVTWASSAPSVATVSSSGVVTGVGVGVATITATSEGKSGSAMIDVQPLPVGIVQVTPSAAWKMLGRTIQLAVATLDSSGNVLTGRPVAWTSSNPAIASVSQTGLVTSLAVGTAVISARSEGVTGTSEFNSILVPVASVNLSPASPTVQEGRSLQLTASPYDSAGALMSGRIARFSSSAPTVAVVSASGIVTGIAEGSAIITAAIDGVNGTTTVGVTRRPPWAVEISPASLNLAIGQSSQLAATSRDSLSNILTGRTVSWSTSDPSVATISQSGNLTAVRWGQVTVSATVEGTTGVRTVIVSDTLWKKLASAPFSAAVTPNSAYDAQTGSVYTASQPFDGSIWKLDAFGNWTRVTPVGSFGAGGCVSLHFDTVNRDLVAMFCNRGAVFRVNVGNGTVSSVGAGVPCELNNCRYGDGYFLESDQKIMAIGEPEFGSFAYYKDVRFTTALFASSWNNWYLGGSVPHQQWQATPGPGVGPAPRLGAVATVDQTSRRVFVYAGSGISCNQINPFGQTGCGSTGFDDLWTLDVASGAWTNLVPWRSSLSSNGQRQFLTPPGPRSKLAYCADRNQLFMFSADTRSLYRLRVGQANDWDLITTFASPQSGTPLDVASKSLICDPSRNRVVLVEATVEGGGVWSYPLPPS